MHGHINISYFILHKLYIQAQLSQAVYFSVFQWMEQVLLVM